MINNIAQYKINPTLSNVCNNIIDYYYYWQGKETLYSPCDCSSLHFRNILFQYVFKFTIILCLWIHFIILNRYFKRYYSQKRGRLSFMKIIEGNKSWMEQRGLKKTELSFYLSFPSLKAMSCCFLGKLIIYVPYSVF